MVAELLLILALATSCAHTESGKASYYGSRGGKTASGERVNPKALTAAHRTLPFGTIVKVIEVKTGKSVEVRITDRGPYIRGRVIDLTPAAFARLAPLARGVITVTLEVVKEAPPRPRRKSRGRSRR
ncbi:MAG: septal ring lytic transglycosylase RlpA family lipoprotein [Deltaproteobacteria bacterium HGW-Deltaproteobacteria-17]|nr:MAG: septal ring lytic transglycosylase RlpA family lipoprotein [Deltaproteobacteria bacterium HGW-Deltaproteobacteria-17]